jgi:hypothetical protein
MQVPGGTNLGLVWPSQLNVTSWGQGIDKFGFLFGQVDQMWSAGARGDKFKILFDYVDQMWPASRLQASRLKNSLQNSLRMSHGLQMDILRRVYDLQMPLELVAASDTASAYKKCPCAVTFAEYVPRGLWRGFPARPQPPIRSTRSLRHPSKLPWPPWSRRRPVRSWNGSPAPVWPSILTFKAQLRLNIIYEPLACLYTFFQIEINNTIPLKMPLNIASFISVCQPSVILLSSFGAAVADRIPGILNTNAI